MTENVLGNSHSGLFESVHCSHRNQVASTKNDGWQFGCGDESAHGGRAGIHAVVAVDDGGKIEFALVESGDQRLLDDHSSAVVLWASDDRGMAMAELHNVLNGLRDSPLVVDGDIAEQPFGGTKIAKDNANSSRGQFGSAALVEGRSHDRHAANIALDELLNDRQTALRVVFGVAQDDVKTAIPRFRLKAANDFRKIRIDDLRYDQPKQIAAAGGQTARMNILVILQLAHDFQDAPLGLGRDGVSAVEYARDRRLGNSGSRGHFAHGVAHGKRPLPDSGTCAARRNTPER